MQAANEAIDELKDQLRAAQTSAARDRAKKSAAGRRRKFDTAKERAWRKDWLDWDADKGRWRLSAAEVAENHGVSVRTLYNRLGNREQPKGEV